MTPFGDRIKIMHDLYIEYRDEVPDFIAHHDVGVPLAMLMVQQLAIPTDRGINYINESWDGLVDLLGLDPAGQYESLDEMLELADIEDEDE